MAVKGIVRLCRQMAGVAPACRAAAETAVAEAAEQARAAAAALAPVDTGRLRESITAAVEGLSAEVVAGCDYAAAVELGGRGRPARPFLYPAAQAQQRAFSELARRLAKEAMEGI